MLQGRNHFTASMQEERPKVRGFRKPLNGLRNIRYCTAVRPGATSSSGRWLSTAPKGERTYLSPVAMPRRSPKYSSLLRKTGTTPIKPLSAVILLGDRRLDRTGPPRLKSFHEFERRLKDSARSQVGTVTVKRWC